MKYRPTKTQKTKIRIYVAPDKSPSFEGQVASYPEMFLMPKEAVRKTKKIVDDFLASGEKLLDIRTVSSDVTSFVYEYRRVKGYDVEIYYHAKRIGIEGVFDKFNKVFRYAEKLTEVEDG